VDISLKHDVKTKYIIFIFLMRSRIPKSLGWCHVLYEYYEVDSQVKQSQKSYTIVVVCEYVLCGFTGGIASK